MRLGSRAVRQAEATAEQRTTGNQLAEPDSGSFEATAAARVGGLDEGGAVDQQMAIACEIGDREGEAASSWNIGIVVEALGNIRRAAGAMRVCVKFIRSIGHTALQHHETYLNRLRAGLDRSTR
ncbi:hypothetical protein [Sorangium sp. So ce1078]|uniref:hypothetical protein n=1 Tax=Sorangium sp. So ce1078 TaxID=3133329 RepID=UPI003F64908B